MKNTNTLKFEIDDPNGKAFEKDPFLCQTIVVIDHMNGENEVAGIWSGNWLWAARYFLNELDIELTENAANMKTPLSIPILRDLTSYEDDESIYQAEKIEPNKQIELPF